jgi:hypothetical protein
MDNTAQEAFHIFRMGSSVNAVEKKSFFRNGDTGCRIVSHGRNIARADKKNAAKTRSQARASILFALVGQKSGLRGSSWQNAKQE